MHLHGVYTHTSRHRSLARNMADDSAEPTSAIFVRDVYALTWLLDNTSLGVGGMNYAKNTNIANRKHVVTLAQDFARDGVRRETTPFIVAPASLAWANPIKFLQGVLKATPNLSGDAAQVCGCSSR